MSGPKVVRIVTREEIMAICEGHLSRLDSVIEEWMRVGHRNNTTDQADIASMKSRRSALQQMLAQDRFAELQKQVPMEIAFVRQDSQARLQQAAATAAEACSSARRTVRTARSLLDALTQAGCVVPEKLRYTLEHTDGCGPEVEAAIAHAFTLLQPENHDEEAAAKQKELTEKLGIGEQRTTLADWIASQPPAEDDEIALKIDRAIGDLIALAGHETATSYRARATAICAERSATKRALLGDSLLLDVAAEVKAYRSHADAVSKLAELYGELARFDTLHARSLGAEIEVALASRDSTKVVALADKATALIAREVEAMVSVARRRAILQGLASLGYEVTEGMATAWVQDGRIVLRKAAQPDYGVELGGGAQSDRLQVRAVGIGDPRAIRDVARDRDMEAIWCSEFKRLQGLMAETGDAVMIERALPVGAMPLKVVATDTSVESAGAKRHGLRTHQISS